MPASLTALFAVTMHQTRTAHVDPVGLERASALLAWAAGATPTVFEVGRERLLVNDVSVDPASPGAAQVRQALLDHHTRRLALPGALRTRQWCELAELYASPPRLYPTFEAVAAAVRSSIPEARATSITYDGPSSPGGPPEGTTDPEHIAPAVAVRRPQAGLAAQLDPLVAAASAAGASANFEQLGVALLALADLERRADDASRTTIVRERRRAVPADLLDRMARLVAKVGAPDVVRKALLALGRDGTRALLDALNAATSPHERRAYIDVLSEARGGEEVLLGALGSSHPSLARDAALVVGRQGLERAVHPLTHLLRHTDQEVRSAAWHALEQVGTREAMEVLRRGR